MVWNPLVAAAMGLGAALILGVIVFAAGFLRAAFTADFAAFFWTGLAFAFTVRVFGAAALAATGASATAGAAGVAGWAAVSSVAASKAVSALSKIGRASCRETVEHKAEVRACNI